MSLFLFFISFGAHPLVRDWDFLDGSAFCRDTHTSPLCRDRTRPDFWCAAPSRLHVHPPSSESGRFGDGGSVHPAPQKETARDVFFVETQRHRRVRHMFSRFECSSISTLLACPLDICVLWFRCCSCHLNSRTVNSNCPVNVSLVQPHAASTVSTFALFFSFLPN